MQSPVNYPTKNVNLHHTCHFPVQILDSPIAWSNTISQDDKTSIYQFWKKLRNTPNCNIFKLYDKGISVFYERFRSTFRCSYSVKIDLKYFYKFRQKAFAPARQDMLGRVENSFNYSSVDSDMASKSFNVCGITLMHSMKARSALFYQGCMKRQLQSFE